MGLLLHSLYNDQGDMAIVMGNSWHAFGLDEPDQDDLPSALSQAGLHISSPECTLLHVDDIAMESCGDVVLSSAL